MSFKIKVTPGDHEFSAEEHESLLDAAIRQGVSLPYSCRNGGCGSCQATLLEGHIRYLNDVTPRGLSADQIAYGAILCCQATARSDLVLKASLAAASGGIKRLPARIASLKKLADDVMLMTLQLPASQRLPFKAGQYINILLKDGRKRAFSLANAPHDDAVLQLHIRSVPGGHFTGQVFSELQEKALLRIEGPLGDFYMREDSERPLILVAGGTGFAPAKAMIEHLLAAQSTKTIHLYWGARNQPDLYLHNLASSWARQHPQIHYTPVLSAATGPIEGQGRTGWVHEAVAEDFPDLSAFDVYACGPPPMIDAARQRFASHGLPADQFYADSFEFSL